MNDTVLIAKAQDDKNKDILKRFWYFTKSG